ncbi:S-adenosyl-L-methionine-dependent methyltransferase [Podospora conica]|nr:S-adenosyl-L-methionine-dependent methyltransferase [Schizothecium conicum]
MLATLRRISGRNVSSHTCRTIARAFSNMSPEVEMQTDVVQPPAQPITATPAPGQIISHLGVRYTTVKEGLAHILVPEATVEANAKVRNDQGVSQVFYNPIQQFNRDLTILTISAHGKEKIAEKELAAQKKAKLVSDKKRKRKDHTEAQEERPSKVPKTPEDEADVQMVEAGAAEGSNDMVEPPKPAAEDNAAPDKPAEPNTETDAPAENGVKPPKFTILDALSASGLRALRYAHEIPFVTSVTSNDLLKAAVESAKLNVQHNRLESKINVSHDDALAHMYTLISKELRRRDAHGKPVKSDKYDVVDLDPYGSAAPFLDAAVQSVRDDGGLLCVTCTDSGVWASNGYPEKCYALYGGVPVKGWFSHEVGLRLVLHSIESAAAKYGLAMEPMMSLSIDFYVRVFVRIRKSPAMVKYQGGKNMVVYNCDSGCGAWTTQPLMRNKPTANKKGSGVFYKHVFAQGPTVPEKGCEHCGSTMHMAGPMYAGRIQSPPFIERVLAELEEAPEGVYGTRSRIRGMLQTALEEIMLSPEEMKDWEKADPSEIRPTQKESREAELAAIDPYPFYVHPSSLAGTIRCQTPPENHFKGALRGLGYRVTRSHCKPGSIKTDAPWSIIWHVMREWARQMAPVKVENIKPGSTAYRLLGLDKAQEAGTQGPAAKGLPEVVFDEKLGQEPKTNLVRYQMNPRENWGPMNRAKGK